MEMAITAAAEHLGVSPDTVGRRIHRGQVTARQVPRPQGHVWLVDVQPAPPTGGGGGQDDKDRLIEVLQAQVLSQSEELHTRRREVQFYGTVLKLVCGKRLMEAELRG